MVTAPGAATNPPHLQVVAVSGPGYRSRPAGRRIDPAARDGRAHRPDAHRAGLAWPAGPLGRGGVADHPGGPGRPRPRRAQPDRPGHRGPGVDEHAHDLLLDVRPAGRGRLYRHRPALVGGAARAPPRPGHPVADRRGPCWPRCRRWPVLANLVPWWELSHPAIWLYGLTAVWTAVIGVIALGGPWRRGSVRSAGAVAALTVAVIRPRRDHRVAAADGNAVRAVGPGSRPGLRIGGEAVGLYAVCGILAAAWAGHAVLRRDGGRPPGGW